MAPRWCLEEATAQALVKQTHVVIVYKFVYAAAAAAKSHQSCPTLCDPVDGSPPGSSAHGIFQARVLEWGAIAFSEICLYIAEFYLLTFC